MVLSLQGCIAVGKTTAVRYFKKLHKYKAMDIFEYAKSNTDSFEKVGVSSKTKFFDFVGCCTPSLN